MENANFVKTEKRRPKSTKRKKLGDQDASGNSIASRDSAGIKSEGVVMSGVKNEANSGENCYAWPPRNGHVDLAPPDVKPGQDELNTSNVVPGSDSVASTLPSLASSMSDPMNEQVVGPNGRPGQPGLPGPPNCVLPGSRLPPMQNRGFPHRPPLPMQMGPMDSHFVPQQSQIFVFSTNLANDAAEAVQSGRCRSIVDFHLDQPATKQFLQAFPADAPLFPGSQMPPYNDGNKLVQKDPLPPYMESDSALANVELWVQQQNASLQEGPFSPSFGPGKQPRSKSGNGGQPRWMPSPNRVPLGSALGDFMGPGPEQMLGPPGYMNDGQMPPRSGMPPGQNLDENLTPEQLQRREEQLAQLQKLKNMLFPEKRNDFDPRRPQGMFPGGPRPGPDNGMMGFPRFPHPGMMPMQPSGMMEPPDGMMGMPMEPGFFGQPALPPNWENMTPEERDWFKLQHEYYLERQKSQMSMGGGGPGFFSDLPPRMPGPMSPMSPSFNGAGPPNPQGFFYQGPHGMNFPPNGHGPDFHPDFIPGMGDGVFPFDNGGPVRINQPGHDPGPVGMGPFAPGARFPNVCKQKRRRPMGEKTDDLYRHLQPAPSPQQFCSLNLFEGQELTITRQLNLAYQEPGYPSPSQSTLTQPRKKKKGDSKQKLDEQKQAKGDLPSTPELFSSASSLLSPLPPTNVSTPNTNTTTPKLTLSPAPVEQNAGSVTADNVALTSASLGSNASSMDSKRQLQMDPFGSAGSTSSSTPSTSSTNASISRNSSVLNNITSATLASLAKGVESLSDRMQLDMKQGGPFRTVQMPENELELSGDSCSGGNLVSLPGSAASIKLENTGAKTPQLSLDGCLPPSRGNSERSAGNNPDGIGCADGNSGGSDEAKEKLVADGPGQSLPSEGLELPPSSRPSPPDGNLPPCNPKHSSPSSIQNMVPVTSMLSPNIIGNANVQIEARAPNTIQYLPAVPCGTGPDGPEDPTSSCVTMPFDSVQLMRDGGMQPGPPNPPGSAPGYGGPVHPYDGVPPPGPGGMIPGYDGPMHGPGGPMQGFDGHMIVRNGLVPGFDVHGQGGFGPVFDGPMHGPGSLPPYGDGPMHGPGGPMSGFDGPMPNQVGPMQGFGGSGGPMSGYNGPPMHGPGCSMPGFEGQCGPMSEFELAVHGHGGPVGPGGPHLPGYNGPVPGFSGALPRHGGSLANHCGGPMPGCHSGPQMMSLPPNQQMFIHGRGGPMMQPAPEPGMPGGNEGQRTKPESSGMTRKEKDRKKRSESAKKNANAASSASFMEAAARESRRMNPEPMGPMGPGSGRMRAGPGMLRLGPVEGGMGSGFMGMGNMEGRIRPGMMPVGLMDGGMRPGMMGMVPMEGGMGPGMMGLVQEEAAMRQGMMGMECEGGLRQGMMGLGPMEGGMRPGMMGGMGPLEGRHGMMDMGPMEGGMRPEMMPMPPGGMIDPGSMMGMGSREGGISVGPPESGLPSSRLMSMGGIGEGGPRPGSNTMVMSPGGNSMRPTSGILLSSDGRPRQGGGPPFSGEPSSVSRSVEGMIVPSPRMEDGRPDMMMMMMGSGGEGMKRIVPSGGSSDVGMRPGSSMMTSMEHGDPSNLRPGSRSLSDRGMMGMGGDGGMRPGSAVMLGMADGGVRPGSALMMGMGGPGDPSGVRPGSAMMMGMGGPGEGVMRPGSAVMMGVGPEGMRPGAGMIPGLCGGENGMRPTPEMMGGMGPVPMRPGSGILVGAGGPGDDPMRMSAEMMSIGPGDGRLRMGSDMIGVGHRMIGRMVDMGFCDPRVGPDGGGGGMMAMQHRMGRMDPGLPMMDGRNGAIFPNSSSMGADPTRRPPPGLDPDRFGMAPGGMVDEPFNAQFQQFQQQLYAKNSSQQPSPTMDLRGLPPGNMGFDMVRNGPNFGPHGGSLIHGGPAMGMGR